MKAPLGENMIGKFLAKAAEGAGIQRPGSKISNHSVRKTCISRLLDADFPENFVAQLSGHKSTESLQSYKSASEKHQRQMSDTLNRQPSTSLTSEETTVLHQVQPTTSGERQSVVTESLQTATRSLAVGYGTSVPGPSDGAGQATCLRVPSSNLPRGCEDRSAVPKRRRVIIESDDED